MKYDTIKIHLYSSLAKTGREHATNIAVQLGLLGYLQHTIDTDKIQHYIADIKSQKTIIINQCSIQFNPDEDIIFNQTLPKNYHPNTIQFLTLKADNITIDKTYSSVCVCGGGFVEQKGTHSKQQQRVKLTFPIQSRKDLLAYTGGKQPIHTVVYQNELAFNNKTVIDEQLTSLFDTIIESICRGYQREGVFLFPPVLCYSRVVWSNMQ